MSSVCFYFQVHQPYRIKKFRVFDIGNDSEYFNDDSKSSMNNKLILERVSRKSYLPTNAILLELLKKHPGFKASFSLSGVFLEQAEKDFPEVVDSFRKLVDTGRVEILSETYYHSLSFLYSRSEFDFQVKKHAKLVKRLFGVTPKIFRNTELIFSNDLALHVEKMGYKGVLAEGADHILDWRSPNFVYSPRGCGKIKLLLKNYRLSDDIAFRFSEKSWKDYPLEAPKFAHWISGHNGGGELINLFMDYETFGEHQWEHSGIFNFLKHLPQEILRNPDNDFVTPSEAIERYESKAELDFPHYVSWADNERDLSAWLSNDLQRDSFDKVYAMEKDVLATRDKKIIEDWRRMQTSDHFYYMCTKWFSDGDVHKYFNPYESPYEAFIAFANAMSDLKLRVQNKL
jgi:alpha-amylase